ncbi:DCPS [Enterospora canceri]|uniref:DCPS n=1 Tax=Enterospora canceri TaxID=1081671 RepID=A0A1Y1S5I0_9MICR|nr:DCPS [Enterospora canceri]
MKGLIVVVGEMEGKQFVYLIDNTSSLEKLSNDIILDQIDGKRMEPKSAKFATNVTFRTTLAYPATEKDVNKYFNENKYIKESHENYCKQNIVTDIPWIDQIFMNEVNTKTGPNYYMDANLVVTTDYKWNGNVDELYLLCIFKDEKYKSLRNLDKCDLNLLKSTRTKIHSILKETFGLSKEDAVLFFHYRPSYYKLHIHIVNISKSKLCLYNCRRNVYLDDVIRNIENYDDYYKHDMHLISNA